MNDKPEDYCNPTSLGLMTTFIKLLAMYNANKNKNYVPHTKIKMIVRVPIPHCLLDSSINQLNDSHQLAMVERKARERDSTQLFRSTT